MVKKILLGLAATAAVLSMAGCKMTDDEEKAITGSGKTKSINKQNDTDDNYRAYISTDFKHAGALVKVTFEDPDEAGFSKMGVIFDLCENKDKSKNFYIIGVAPSAYSNFYISKFENVTDLQADNFGTKLTSNPAKETEFIALNTGTSKNTEKDITLPAKAEDGSISLYIYFKAFEDGKYECAALNLTDEEVKQIKIDTFKLADLNSSKILKSYNITDGFEPVTAANKVPQNKIAVYANVLKHTTLNGKWNFTSTYLEAEEIEE